MPIAYEKDFYGWCHDQVLALSAGRFDALDLRNLAEEIGCLGNRERKELITFLELLFRHILKFEFHPEFQTRSWLKTIKEQRFNIREILLENPSLQPKLIECCDKAYEKARRNAAEETHLKEDVFPEAMYFTFEWSMVNEFRLEMK